MHYCTILKSQRSWKDVCPATKHHNPYKLVRAPRTHEQKVAETAALAKQIKMILRRDPQTKRQLMKETGAYESDVRFALQTLNAVWLGALRSSRGTWALPPDGVQ